MEVQKGAKRASEGSRGGRNITPFHAYRWLHDRSDVRGIIAQMSKTYSQEENSPLIKDDWTLEIHHYPLLDQILHTRDHLTTLRLLFDNPFKIDKSQRCLLSESGNSAPRSSGQTEIVSVRFRPKFRLEICFGFGVSAFSHFGDSAETLLSAEIDYFG